MSKYCCNHYMPHTHASAYCYDTANSLWHNPNGQRYQDHRSWLHLMNLLYHFGIVVFW